MLVYFSQSCQAVKDLVQTAETTPLGWISMQPPLHNDTQRHTNIRRCWQAQPQLIPSDLEQSIMLFITLIKVFRRSDNNQYMLHAGPRAFACWLAQPPWPQVPWSCIRSSYTRLADSCIGAAINRQRTRWSTLTHSSCSHCPRCSHIARV